MVTSRHVILFTICLCLQGFTTSGLNVGLNVSVPENAAVGRNVVSLSARLGKQREGDGRCRLVSGDPYGRFTINTNCTVLIANSLDRSVTSEYTLRVGVSSWSTEKTPNIVSVRIHVEDVEGYPPVYNESCAIPTKEPRHAGNPLSLGLLLDIEGTTSDGDYFSIFDGANSVDLWMHNMKEEAIETTGEGDCNFQLVWAVLVEKRRRIFRALWDAGLRNWSCSDDSDQGSNQLSYSLFMTPQGVDIPTQHEWIVNNVSNIYQFTGTWVSQEGSRLACKLPSFRPGVNMVFRGERSFQIDSIQKFDMILYPVGCEAGKYGITCQKTCICKNGALCHVFNGACKCTQGWQGVACDIPKPSVGIETAPSDPQHITIFGNVTLRCRAHHVVVRTLHWHFPNGSKMATSGVNESVVIFTKLQTNEEGIYTCTAITSTGEVMATTFLLNASCPEDRKGWRCTEVCGCERVRCDRWAGCICGEGWTGSRCHTRCPEGTYGRGCTRQCTCQYGVCRPSDGSCNCRAGWYGSDCSRPCVNGRYGRRCQYTCACRHNASCSHVDGSCQCVGA
ncbi:uncharacterized protein LOC118419652 [Branchiostoma floridae]|uniref:Uncharacterized protein LOC118419652 n=1 Tax=Branchiostoma floridae TaxID=7739 RepID=A0A9J7LHU6_BRAFL|nr:uncharacterized protein LOC118419652 [Branchiostoma floridae]